MDMDIDSDNTRAIWDFANMGGPFSGCDHNESPTVLGFLLEPLIFGNSRTHEEYGTMILVITVDDRDPCMALDNKTVL